VRLTRLRIWVVEVRAMPLVRHEPSRANGVVRNSARFIDRKTLQSVHPYSMSTSAVVR
jgi:hypothetical protein